MLRGYDVSHYQGRFDHAAAHKEGFDFCIVKATDGIGPDPCFEYNWPTLKKLGMPRGAYHYARPGSHPASTEANAYLKTADLRDDDFRPILDLEQFGEHLDPGPFAAWVKEWVDTVSAATGKRAIIYTDSFWDEAMGGQKETFDTGLWVHRYSDDMVDPVLLGGWDRWILWQWAGTAGNDFYPHYIGPVKEKLGPQASLTVAGQKVDQDVTGPGVELDDLVGRRH